MRKGFTLIEVIAVISILGILFILTLNEVLDISESAKQKAYTEQIDRIEASANLWVLNNNIDVDSSQTYMVNINDLVSSGVLSSQDIINPIDNSIISGCVNIYYNGEYTYEYDSTCGITTYTISYDLNGGIGVSNNPKSYTADMDDFIIESPSKKGYIFTGWTGTGYDTNTFNPVIKSGSTGDYLFTANWEKEQYNIDFDLDGGFFIVSNKSSFYVDTPDITIYAPAKNGYDFLGWTGTDLPIMTKTLKILKGSTGDKVYTANWAVKEYNLTVNLNGGIIGSSSDDRYYQADVGSTINLLTPTKSGSSFSGWTVSGLGSLVENGVFTMGYEDATVTANWDATMHTLTIDPNGGIWENYTDSVTYQIVEDGTKTISNPYRDNYSFIGWTITGSDSDISGGTFTMGTEDATMTANWSQMKTNFVYTGAYENFTPPVSGYYQIELWGASGGAGSIGLCTGGYGGAGGFGGYLEFQIYLTPGQTLIFYVGQKGTEGSYGATYGVGGFSDGHNGLPVAYVSGAGGGGGGSTFLVIGGDVYAKANGGGGGGGGADGGYWKYPDGSVACGGCDYRNAGTGGGAGGTGGGGTAGGAGALNVCKANGYAGGAGSYSYDSSKVTFIIGSTGINYGNGKAIINYIGN
ncbi:MAG: InlB B-repeat-containing protein [Bacilli bacterium]|nr:InlB B-repeat-containing protein [Bacilli bacterium]